MLFSKYLENRQNFILKKYLNFSFNLRKNGIYNSPHLYPCTWYDNFSKSFLKYFYLKKNFRNLVYLYIKEIILIFSILNYKIYFPKNLKKNYKNFYVTWIKNHDLINGKLKNDRYLFTRSHSKSSLYLCINLDKNFDYQKTKNIIVFSKISMFRSNTLINIYYLVSFIFSILFSKKIIYSLNVYSFFAYILNIKINKKIKYISFKKVLMSYEGQPFQNLLIRNIKRKDKKIKTIGIIKSFQPFPIHLYKNNDAPDKIYYSDNKIKKHMINKLLWKENDFEKKINYRLNNLKGKIVLPFSINNYDKVYEIISELYKKKKIKNFETLETQIHPNTAEMNEQLILKKKLKKLFKNKNKKNKEKLLLAIGSTSVILENLLLGNKVIQIYEDEIAECCSKSFWPGIKITKLINNVVSYSLQ